MNVELSVPPGIARHSFRAMGTAIHVVAPERELERAATAVELLFAERERALSRFLPESELSELNHAAGRPFVASALLFEAVRAALEAARATGGLFDPSLLPDMARVGYDRTFAEIGSPEAAVGSPQGGGGWRSVTLDRSTRSVTLPAGVGLDLGGIAKGMAVDAALERLAELEVDCALVSAGGDLAVRGLPPGLRAWQVAVGEDDHDVVPLARGAIATSSTARRRWRQGEVQRHHILDPRTGEPTRNPLREVSVAAPTCRQAEVAAKAVFVLGPTLGPAFVSRHGLAARVVREDGRRNVAGPWPAPWRAAA